MGYVFKEFEHFNIFENENPHSKSQREKAKQTRKKRTYADVTEFPLKAAFKTRLA